MRVVIGGDSLLGPLTGIGQYTRHLARNMASSDAIEDIKFLAHGRLFGSELIKSPPSENTEHEPEQIEHQETLFSKIRTTAAQSPSLVKLYQAGLPAIERWALRDYSENDVFHSPNYMLPSFKGRKIVTILDLSTLRYPEFHPVARVNFINNHMRKAIETADHIITISDYIRSEIISYFGVESERITTTYLGVDDSFHPIDSAQFEPIRQRLDLKYKQYFLFVSTVEPRKNLDRLLDAYEAYAERTTAKALPLIVVGLPGWKSEHIHQRLQKLQGIGQIRYLGYVEQHYMPQLIGGARALLYPSLYEGFGLPIVESMNAGTAVLTSRDSAMSEVAGEAAKLVSPLDTEEIFEAIWQMSEDDDYVSNLEQKGLNWGKRYSWRQCAKETLFVYQRALK